MTSMLVEPTTSQPNQALQAHPETPQSWASVLVVAIVIVLASTVAGAIGGGLLLLGLVAWLAGPEAVSGLPYNRLELPAEAQALVSEDGFSLCARLFAVPLAIVLFRLAIPRMGSTAREYLGLKWPGLRQ